MPHLLPVMVRERRRLFYLGGRPGVAETGADNLRRQYPQLLIRTHHGYLASDEMPDLIQQLNDYRPNVLMVGMGMPVQEKWIQRHRSQLNANVIFPVGAYMDYQANIIPTPPRWLAAACLEWMYRLLAEPRRLSYRYMVEPWWVLAGFLGYSLRHPGRLTEVSAARSLQEMMKRDKAIRGEDVLAVMAAYKKPVEL
jgi:N-acetylglucosaminyldiphosphoundecaprenol N-acetyl-beta-D-mannosaminyltransferase